MKDIFQAIRTKNNEEYDLLINTTNFNVVNNYGQNLLQESISFDNQYVSNDLINKNIDLNHKDKDGKTALHYCASHNNFNIAEAILKKECEIDICDNYGNNPLWVSVFNSRGVYDIVKLFVKYKANLNNKNNAGKTPLDFAIQINDEELIKILKT